jgi:multisubunit Na+/H+ antiporter MnhE subunit
MKKIISTVIREILDQLWTIVALVIGWLVLEGSAKTVTANLVIGALVVWIVTSKFRNPKE